MIDNLPYEIIDIEGMDREVAILIYKNKIYEDVNHRYALDEAMKNDGKELGLDLEENIDEVAKLTHELSKKEEISCLDVFVDGLGGGYLISHFEINLINNWDLIVNYAKEHNIVVGTFIDFTSSKCKIFAL